LFRDTYDGARAKFLELAEDWWERGTGLELTKQWDGKANRVEVSWTAGDTRTEVEIWLERA